MKIPENKSLIIQGCTHIANQNFDSLGIRILRDITKIRKDTNHINPLTRANIDTFLTPSFIK